MNNYVFDLFCRYSCAVDDWFSVRKEQHHFMQLDLLEKKCNSYPPQLSLICDIY